MPTDAGKGLNKKILGQRAWLWPVELVGAYFAYRWYENYKASQAANAALTSLSPLASSSPTSGTTGLSTTPAATWQQWLQEALSGITVPGGNYEGFYNALTAWINGSCVQSTYATAVGDAIQQLGAPPGFGITPAITVCASPSPTNPQSPPHTQPNPAHPAGPAPGAPPIVWNTVTQAVGQLSTKFGRNAPQSAVEKWIAEGQAKGLSGLSLQQFLEAQNVGYISQGLKTPSISEVDALAEQLAGGAGQYAKLQPYEQNEFLTLANVQYLEKLNGK